MQQSKDTLRMVSWAEIRGSIGANASRGFNVEALSVRSFDEKIDTFPLVPTIVIEPPKAVAAPSPSPPIVLKRDTISKPCAISTPVLPTPAVSQLEPRTGKRVVDPIVLGIERFEPLYVGAPPRTRHQMECEEAQRVEGLLNSLYTGEGGRSRGWTKVGLEGMIKPRCASGGDLKELDRAKKGFAWQIIGEDKLSSAFLDFVCVAKGIRIAVWFADEKIIQIYPAADKMSLDDDVKSVPLYHITCKGELRQGSADCKDLYTMAGGYTIMPALSVMKSLSGLSLSELESVGTRLGMASVEGSKAERVASIAAYKLKQRLLG